MTKDEMKDKISMALKDLVLQQGFEIICKNLAELKEENKFLKEQCLILADGNVCSSTCSECNFVKYDDWDTEHHCPKFPYDRKNVLSESFNIHDGQKWTITEVDINEIKQPTIICSSFNAG